jgi:hypothetical protein
MALVISGLNVTVLIASLLAAACDINGPVIYIEDRILVFSL